MRYLQLFFAVATAIYIWVEYLDAKDTVASYPKGGSEGNEIATFIFRTNRPTLRQLVLFNLVEYAVLFTPLWLVNLLTSSHDAASGGFAISIAVGMPIGSYLAVRSWAKWGKS